MADSEMRCCGNCVYYNGEMGDKSQFCDDREDYRNDTDIACYRFRQRRELTDVEKAYEWLDETRGTYNSEIDCKAHETCFEALKLMQELKARNLTPEICMEYMKFEDECVHKGWTFKSILEAREARTPKRPDIWGDGYADGKMVYDMFDCPGCGKSYELENRTDYCPDCGQRLDWSGFDE